MTLVTIELDAAESTALLSGNDAALVSRLAANAQATYDLRSTEIEYVSPDGEQLMIIGPVGQEGEL